MAIRAPDGANNHWFKIIQPLFQNVKESLASQLGMEKRNATAGR